MHTEDGNEGDSHVSGYYGLAPTIIGVAFAGGLIWFMFALADGFA